MKGKLKPCPFCGERAEMHTISQFDFAKNATRYEYRVVCGGCLISTPQFAKKGETANAWNRRADNG